MDPTPTSNWLAEPRPLTSLNFIGVLTNLHSRRNRKGSYNAKRLKSILGNRGLVYESGSLLDLPKIVSEFRQRGVNVVGINGGDGTFAAVLNQWLSSAPAHQLPVFLPLRGGTMNVIANEINLRGTPASLLQRYVETLEGRIHPPGLHWFKTLQVEISTESKPRFGFVWSQGLSYNLVHEYYAHTSATPAAALTLSLATTLGCLPPLRRIDFFNRLWKPVRAKMIADGIEFPFQEINLCAASTINKLVLWFSPFAKGVGGKDAGFGLLINSMGWLEILRSTWTLSRGKTLNDRHWSQIANQLQVTTRDGFLMDGELYLPKGEVQYILREGPPITVLVPGTRPGPYAFA